MLLIKKIDQCNYEIYFNKELICIFYDNIVNVTYFIKNENITDSENLHEVIRNVRLYINKRNEVRNVS